MSALICAPGYVWPCGQALAVATCESTLRLDAVSPDGQNIGPMQVNVIHSGKLRPGESLYDPAVSVRIAHDIYVDQGWGPWACRPN